MDMDILAVPGKNTKQDNFLSWGISHTTESKGALLSWEVHQTKALGKENVRVEKNGGYWNLWVKQKWWKRVKNG